MKRLCILCVCLIGTWASATGDKTREIYVVSQDIDMAEINSEYKIRKVLIQETGYIPYIGVPTVLGSEYKIPVIGADGDGRTVNINELANAEISLTNADAIREGEDIHVEGVKINLAPSIAWQRLIVEEQFLTEQQFEIRKQTLESFVRIALARSFNVSLYDIEIVYN